MHVLREILRQKLGLGRSHREVVASVGVSIGKVSAVLARARSLGLYAAAVEALGDAELTRACTRRRRRRACDRGRTAPRCTWSLRRKGVTLALLTWSSSSFTPGLGTARSAIGTASGQASVARDAAGARRRRQAVRRLRGMRPKLFDPQTGEIIEVELFVAVLGASNYTTRRRRARSKSSTSCRACPARSRSSVA